MRSRFFRWKWAAYFVALAIAVSLLTVGAASAAAPSNGWYGFIHTEYRFDRHQEGLNADVHLVQEDKVTTQFRGDLPERIVGRFTSEEDLAYHVPCGIGSYEGEEWSAEVGILEEREPSPFASVVGVPASLQPGVAGNYRLNQGGAAAAFSGVRHFCLVPDVEISGPGAIGISQVRADDGGDNVNVIPAAAGWIRLAGSKTLRTEFNTSQNHTVTTTTWTWSLTREADVDYDGVPDTGEHGDNCPPSEPGDPDSVNPGQEDADGDGQGNACEVAKIVVVKQTNPDGSDQTFEFTGDLAGTIKDGGAISKDVEPGRYSTSELLPNGWDLESISCQDPTGDSSGDKRLQTATLNVAIQETVICTFTNTNRGHAKVVKTVNGRIPLGSESFGFELRQGASTTLSGNVLEPRTANAANGGMIDFAEKLVPGTPYALCEVVMPGWMTTLGPPFYVVYNPSGDNSTVCTDFTVTPGQSKSFAIDNKPPPGGLGRTIGFWKNWASCTTSNGKQKPVLDNTLVSAGQAGITIGTLTLRSNDCLKAVRLLDKSTIDTGKKMASDPAFNLAAQLLAARLNVVAGAGTCPAAVNALNLAQTQLTDLHFAGISHDKMSATQTTQANAFATTLDKYNNNQLC